MGGINFVLTHVIHVMYPHGWETPQCQPRVSLILYVTSLGDCSNMTQEPLVT